MQKKIEKLSWAWRGWTELGCDVSTRWGDAKLRRCADNLAKLSAKGPLVVAGAYGHPHGVLDGEVPTGSWAVLGAPVELPDPLGLRMAAVVAWPSKGHRNAPPFAKVVRWERATRDGDPAVLQANRGLGCICPVSATEKLGKSQATRDKLQNWLEVTREPVKPKLPGASVVVFATGVGDGRYPVWWGLDAKGVRRMLVVDFELFEVES